MAQSSSPESRPASISPASTTPSAAIAWTTRHSTSPTAHANGTTAPPAWTSRRSTSGGRRPSSVAVDRVVFDTGYRSASEAPARRSASAPDSSSTGTRTWSVESRSRTVTVSSSRVS